MVQITEMSSNEGLKGPFSSLSSKFNIQEMEDLIFTKTIEAKMEFDQIMMENCNDFAKENIFNELKDKLKDIKLLKEKCEMIKGAVKNIKEQLRSPLMKTPSIVELIGSTSSLYSSTSSLDSLDAFDEKIEKEEEIRRKSRHDLMFERSMSLVEFERLEADCVEGDEDLLPFHIQKSTTGESLSSVLTTKLSPEDVPTNNFRTEFFIPPLRSGVIFNDPFSKQAHETFQEGLRCSSFDGQTVVGDKFR